MNDAPRIRQAVRIWWRQYGWQPYTRLFLMGDRAAWVLDEEMCELRRIAAQIGIRVVESGALPDVRRQAVFHHDQFFLLRQGWWQSGHRIGLAFLHGRPGAGIADFDACHAALGRHHDRVERVQVSNRAMREIVLNSGIAAEKVFQIPIAVNPSYFRTQTAESRRQAREQFGLPQSAVVIGSFQKDGNGWGEGLEPKLIKGPDVFLKTIELLKPRVPELHVLLSGPARGYVQAGLQRLGVPYRHAMLKTYPEVGELYQALDLYLVASRDEGGPKAVLESMASGVPLVTTRVGQAVDLVRHAVNGWIVDVEDAEGLAHWAEYVLQHRDRLAPVLEAGRATAAANTYDAQLPLWRQFMDGFVECRHN